ncbi:unnamed protein product [Rotaria magnacalcarata]|uniref:Secreted protein n=1 Tax=Rotaria magnacalcarata TaxID=392030 RepID=A0A815Z4F0_9BILA|nr:unnamed protein product [Rotaria magnacalcarata]CAF4440670.1 unnamed protein product [Rotaria magnacalcarata]
MPCLMKLLITLKLIALTALTTLKDENNHEIRHIGGVHFTPKRHQVITFYLIRIISNAPEKQNVISSTAQSSSNCHRLSDQNNRNLAYDSSNQKQNHHQCVNRHKRILFNQEAEQFGRAFGIAWSTFRKF